MRFGLRGAALAAALVLGACSGGDPAGVTQSQHERAGDRGLGSTEAPVTLIEYASVACPACAAFHEQVFPTLQEYIDAGQLRFVLREMIAGNAQFAVAGSSLARCVPEDRFYDMIDLLFRQQRAIYQAAQTQGSARAQYLTIARSMGMSEQEFVACLSNEAVNRDVIAADERAAADGITRTPSFLFNGALLETRRAPGDSRATVFLDGEQLLIDGAPVEGGIDAETFRRIIDHLIAQSHSE
jgi:protein-disulfide isomerase